MDPYKCKVVLFVLFSFHTMIPIAIQLAEELVNIFYLRKCTGHFYTKKKEAVFLKSVLLVQWLQHCINFLRFLSKEAITVNVIHLAVYSIKRFWRNPALC